MPPKIYGFEVFDEINLCKLLYIILIPAGKPYMQVVQVNTVLLENVLIYQPLKVYFVSFGEINFSGGYVFLYIKFCPCGNHYL